jgi:UDP:flavonoid glycosyltransferase YjiC (YdhE family)
MTRILITTMPADGHVRPGLPLVHELVAAGHDVAWYTGAKYVDLVERAGATALPFPAELESDFGLFEDRPEVDAEHTPGIRELRRDILDGFIAPVPAQVRALTRIVRSWTPDVIVSDSTFVAGPAVAEREGIPSVAFSVVPLVLSSVDTARSAPAYHPPPVRSAACATSSSTRRSAGW